MNYTARKATDDDKELLVALRIDAMKESLETVGRFNPERARSRFLDTFNAKNTTIILVDNNLAGFYVVLDRHDHLRIDHLYIHPEYQGSGLGGEVIATIKELAQQKSVAVRLMALKQSRSNLFYQKHGFHHTHQEEWDNHYEYTPQPNET